VAGSSPLPTQTFRPLLQQEQHGIDAKQLSGHNYKCTKKWRNGQAVTDYEPRKGRGYAKRERKTISPRADPITTCSSPEMY